MLETVKKWLSILFIPVTLVLYFLLDRQRRRANEAEMAQVIKDAEHNVTAAKAEASHTGTDYNAAAERYRKLKSRYDSGGSSDMQ